MSAQTNVKPSSTPISYYIHGAICLFIMIFFGKLEPIEPLTPLGMNLIGVFLGVLYGWVFVEIVWPSLAGILALMLVVGMKPGFVLNKSFGDPIVQMMFFIFVFCATISHYGLSKFISLWFITRKSVAGKPWLFSFTLLSSMFILAGLTSASPATIIGWSILYGICDVCGYKKGDGYPIMMVFGIAFASQIGMSIIPFKQAALTVFSAYETMSGNHIEYAAYMVMSIFICALCTVGYILIGKYIFKPDVSKLAKLDPKALDSEGALVLNKVQKTVLFFLFLLVALLLIPNFLPKTSFITVFLRSIGNTGIVIMLVTIMAFIRVNGKALLNFKVMVDSGVAWAVVLLLALVQPLSAAMASPDSGITNFLMQIINPLFGDSSPILFAVCISGIAIILTQVMNNGAVGIAFMPLVHSYCQATGAAPEIPVILIVFAIHFALLTPAASASAALLHGNEWIDSKTIMKVSPIVVAMSWFVSLAILAVFAPIFF